MSKKVQCGICGQLTSKFDTEVVEPESKDQEAYERFIGLDCH